MKPQIHEGQQVIRYRVTMDDIIAFNEFHLLRSPAALRSQQRVRIGASLIMAIVYFILGLLISKTWPAVLGLWFPVLFALLGVGFYNLLVAAKIRFPQLLRKMLRQRYSAGENKAVICDHIMAVDSSGFMEKTDYNETRFSWGALERIETEENYTYLYTSAVQAFIIPHKSILEGDLGAFLQGIKKHYKPEQLLEPAEPSNT